jgi:hypothetical protein
LIYAIDPEGVVRAVLQVWDRLELALVLEPYHLDGVEALERAIAVVELPEPGLWVLPFLALGLAGPGRRWRGGAARSSRFSELSRS